MPFIQNNVDITTYFAKITDYSGWLQLASGQSFGNNSSGQLGLNTIANNYTSPVVLTGQNNWIDAAYLRSGLGLVLVGQNNQGWFSGGLALDTTNRSTPVQVGAVSNWTSVSGGQFHTLAIQSPGTLWATGLNTWGQLGLNTTTNYSSLIQVGTNTNWTSVSSGFYSTAAIQTPGTLWAWGLNQQGQLGINTNISNVLPTQVGTLLKSTQVAGGQYHTVNLQSGLLWAWGNNAYGQLGNNSTTNFSSAVQIGTQGSWTAVAAGALHTVAIQSPGTLWAWGNNSFGQLGTSNQTNYSSPVQIGAGGLWTAVACGYSHTVALQTPGTLWAWGNNSWGQLGTSNQTNYSSPVQIGAVSTWTAVAGGNYHTIALAAPRALYSWGLNSYGQLGNNSTTNQSSPIQVGASTNWFKISAGAAHTVALLNSGGLASPTFSLWAWGSNSYGQLGQGNQTNTSSPVQVGQLSNWYTVTAGQYFNLAAQTNGTLWAWGSNSYGQLGVNTSTNFTSPVQVGGSAWYLENVGYYHSLAVLSNGVLFTWGNNSYGQLGLNTSSIYSSPIQTTFITSANWGAVAAGNFHLAAVQSNGTLWTWGGNSYGQLGLNIAYNQSSPTQLGATSTWTRVACGYQHTLAIQSNGTLYAFGNNSYGQLGINNQINISSPAQVGNSSLWTAVASLYQHSAGIQSPGILYMWGANTFGQLGINNILAQSAPTAVNNNIWSRISCGYGHTVALQTNGSLFAWGLNLNGQLGLLDNTNRSVPVQVGAVSLWTSIAAGYYHTLALQTPGTLWAWGLNSYGQLGNNSNTNISTQIQVGAVSTWTKIAAGAYYSIALQSNGTLYAWGLNDNGQLGVNQYISYSSPVQVGVVSTWSTIAVNATLTAALQSNGTFYTWGSNITALTGNPASPVQVGSNANWTSVVMGQYAGYGIQTPGTLWAWGNNSYGQLGTYVASNTSSPVQVGNYWLSFSGSSLHTMGIQTNGTLWAWGNNAYGQLGLSDTNNRSVATQIGRLNTWTAVACGQYHTLAIQTPGTLWAWGNNSYGELGLNTTTRYSSPIQVGTLSNWVAISCGYYFSAAIQSGGTLWAWGNNSFGQFGNGAQVSANISPIQTGVTNYWTQISCGLNFMMAIASPGSLYSCGYNGVGQLGQNNSTLVFPTLTQVGQNTNWIKVSAQAQNSYGLQNNNTLWAWGNGNNGQLGNPAFASSQAFSPIQVVSNLNNLYNWAKVNNSYQHSLATQSNGTLWAWGRNDYGQLGQSNQTNRSSPVQVGTATWSQASGGQYFTIGIQSNGTLWTWGSNSYGQLGNSTLTNLNVLTPTQVGAVNNWSIVAAGATHSVSLQSNGTLWAWGNNTYGQVGINYLLNYSSPVQVGALNYWTSITSGSYSTAGIESNGTLWTWGYNANGQLGNNSTSNLSSPSQVGASNSWTVVSMGYQHTLGLQTPGTLWAWGYNANGQLGNNSNVNTSTPVQIGAVSTWTAVVSGWQHSAGIQSAGVPWTWGYNAYGQLGNNSTSNTSSPVQPGSGAPIVWTSIVVGNTHSVGIQKPGTLWTWGSNSWGQLGTSQAGTVNTISPVQVGTSANWVYCFAGWYATFAIQKDGSMWACGYNQFGSLGTGDLTRRYSLVQVGSGVGWSTVTSTTLTAWAVSSAGTLYAAGLNSTGNCGTGSISGNVTSWTPVAGGGVWTKWVSGSQGSGVVGLQSNGTLWGWGANANNMFAPAFSGGGPYTSPVQISTLSNWVSVSISAQGGAYLAIQSNGTMWANGSGQYGNFGNNSTGSFSSPLQVSTSSNWATVWSTQSSYAINSLGQLFATGLDQFGQLGDGATSTKSAWFQVGAGTTWTNVGFCYMTTNYSVAWISNTGATYTSGSNSYGQLGNGAQTNIGGGPYSIPAQTGSFLLPISNISKISPGGLHTLAIANNGSMYSWGLNNYGQLGINSTSNQSLVVQIGNSSSWTQIACGYAHTLAIQSPGTLWAWGLNSYGQLGTSNQVNYSSPVQIGAATTWINVYSGSNAYTSAALQSNGTLWAWGLNTFGSLGNSTNTLNYSSPVQVGALSNWTSVSFGLYAAAAIQSPGTLWAWGSNSYGQLGATTYQGSNIYSPVIIGTQSIWTALACGYYHTAGIQSNGSLWAWGYNNAGQLGNNSNQNMYTPVQVLNTIDNWATVAVDPNNLDAAAGVTSNGTLYTWGANSFGQLGQNDLVWRLTPVQMGGLSTWTTVSVGFKFMMALQTPGTLWQWGSFPGNASSSPVQVGALSTWTKISAGNDHVLAIQTPGTLWSWGVNSFGQLGNNTTNLASQTSPSQVGATNYWTQISAGQSFSAGIQSGGTLWTWGSNVSGQLGLSDTVNRSSPVQVGAVSTWTSVSAGQAYILALQTPGTLWSWGNNQSGQLGNNTSGTNISSPIQIGAVSTWTSVSAGAGNSLATQTPGTLWTWGVNSTGSLGLNTTNTYVSPVQLGTLSIWNKIYTAFSGGIGLVSNGTMFSWGNNSYGQLGLGNQLNSYSSPVYVLGKGGYTALSNWTTVACGQYHTLAINTYGQLWAWGNNQYGGLGLNTTTNYSVPYQVGGLSNWVSVTGGALNSSLSIQNTGTLYAWGYNGSGQLGTGNLTNYSSPVQVGTSSTWAQVSCGYQTTTAIQYWGTLTAWGQNNYYQAGINTPTNFSSPVQILGPAAGNWTNIASGTAFAQAVQTDGSLYIWGLNNYGQLGNNGTANVSFPIPVGSIIPVNAVNASCYFTALIQSNGTLWALGNNSFGQLGQNNVQGYSSPVQIGVASTWSRVSNGYYHALALQSPGTLWAWGSNSYGQLGVNTSIAAYSTPKQVGAINYWTSISAGATHTFAIQSPGTLWAWGLNSYGQLGTSNQTNYSSPLQVGALSSWTQVACGYNFTAAIQAPGTLWTWGLNSYGQLAQNNQTNYSSPVQVGVAPNWLQIACGFNMMAAIQYPGLLWAWGLNSLGQLGTSNQTNYSSPVQVGLLSTWTQISCGYNFTTALQTPGTLWSWGNNSFGQLGTSDMTHRSSPVQVGAASTWTQISCGYLTATAIQSPGVIYTWGNNSWGQLGTGNKLAVSSPIQINLLNTNNNWVNIFSTYNGVFNLQSNGNFPVILSVWGYNGSYNLGLGINTNINISSPLQTGYLSSWSQVSAGLTHAVGIQSGGTLWAWGNNTYGQLGTGDTVQRSIPTQVYATGNNYWTQVSAGAYHTVGIQSPGTLWAWGLNTYGQVGNNNTTNQNNPVQIGSSSTWTAVACGYYHTVALQTPGTLWAWGNNSFGQLGQNNQTNYSSPVQIGVLSNWTKVNAGYYHTEAVQTNGVLYAWGNNSFGQLGVLNNTNIPINFATSSYPVQQATGYFKKVTTSLNEYYFLSGIDSTLVQNSTADIPTIDTSNSIVWTTYDTGANHFVGIEINGTAWSIGNNSYGQLGLGDQTYRSSLVQIGTGSNWSKVVCADYGSMLIDNSLNAWVFGNNNQYQLGLSDTTNRSSPVQITYATGIQTAAMDNNNVWLIDGSNNLWGGGTGNNNYYNTTLTPTTNYSSPTQVGSLNIWKTIGAGNNHTVIITTTGALYSWGNNSYGQLGLNSVGAFSNSPLQIGSSNNWTNISSGLNYTLALQTNGTLWAWGRNNLGQLGTSNTVNYSSPVQVGAVTLWNKTSAGSYHSLAIQSPGTLWAWGYNVYGQLGTNTTQTVSSPVQIVNTTWTSISAGYTSAFGIQSPGTLWAWGNNQYGQLGFGDTGNRSYTTQVGTNSNWTTVYGNGYANGFTAGLQSPGTLWTWGYNTNGQLGLGDLTNRSSPVQVASYTLINYWTAVANGGGGGYSTLAIQSPGTLWAWGTNTFGQLGLGDTTARSFATQVGNVSNWTSIAAGLVYGSAGIQSPGTLWTWGVNSWGQLGLGDVTNRSTPVQVGTNTNWTSVSASSQYFMLGLQANGTLWAWGQNNLGQLAQSNSTNYSSPVQIGALNSWAQVYAGAGSGYAIQSNGTLWSWGYNIAGELGLGDTTNRYSPVQIGALSTWTKVGTGNSYTLAIQTPGTLWAWGQNANGQLGLSDVTNRSSPVQVGALSTWTNVSAGNNFTLAIQNNGTLWACGYNTQGQLGLNTSTSYSSLVQVGTLSTWSSLFNGLAWTSAFAIQSPGTLWAWGNNSFGQLGRGNSTNVSSPIQVPAGNTYGSWKQLSLGGGQTAAIQSNGTLWTWGLNSWGQLGINNQLNYPQPQPINITNTWSAVACGYFHTLAIQSPGTLWSWGNNSYGQLGSSNTTNRSSPTQVGALGVWTAVACGYYHTLAIQTPGTLWAWGRNDSGQLGVSDTTNRYSPVQVGSTSTWTSVAGGGSFSAGIQSGGSLYMWGTASGGQLGLNTSSGSVLSPIQLGALSPFTSVSTGNAFTMALQNNQLSVWGGNNQGQLGIGDLTTRISPIQLNGSWATNGWTQVACGYSHTAAIQSNGTLWTWGLNSYGQLGNQVISIFGSYLVYSSFPTVQIAGLWSSVACGYAHTAAIQTNGTLWTWGSNSYGQLGANNILSFNTSPAQVGTLSVWTRVAAGYYHTVATQSNGTLWAWGNNSYGQLGINTVVTSVYSPVQVGSLSNWTNISAGNNFTLAEQSNGSLYSWGLNTFAQLGLLVNYQYPLQKSTGNLWTGVATNQNATILTGVGNTVWGFGNNSFGQLGINTTTLSYQYSPVQLGTGSINTIVKVETKANSSIILFR